MPMQKHADYVLFKKQLEAFKVFGWSYTKHAN